MSRFYGFSYEYIIGMDADIFTMYNQGMIQIKSEEILNKFTISSYPSLKEDSRKVLHKKIYKTAFPIEFNSPKNVVKLSDLSKVLNG